MVHSTSRDSTRSAPGAPEAAKLFSSIYAKTHLACAPSECTRSPHESCSSAQIALRRQRPASTFALNRCLYLMPHRSV